MVKMHKKTSFHTSDRLIAQWLCKTCQLSCRPSWQSSWLLHVNVCLNGINIIQNSHMYVLFVRCIHTVTQLVSAGSDAQYPTIVSSHGVMLWEMSSSFRRAFSASTGEDIVYAISLNNNSS